ncbi:MAG: DUF814 domain-containing protein [Ignavibacteriae bacterium]|nr:DUF814 domain-containing protein [Ignavibacteriota bacterium]
MLTNYYTLSYLAARLAEKLVGTAISEAFSQERDQLVLRFGGIDDALIISCDRVINTLYLRPQFARAKSNSVDVLERCVGQTITAVDMHPVDRVVMFRLKSGERLDAYFFGAKSNVVVVGSDEKIVDAFRNSKDKIGTQAEYRSGEILFDFDAFRRRFSTPQLATISTLLREEFPTLGATLTREVLHRAGVLHAIGAMSIDEPALVKIQQALGAVLTELTNPLARVYIEHAGAEPKLHFSLVTLRQLQAVEEQKFENIFEAIRFYVARVRVRESIDEQKHHLLGKLRQKVAKARRTIEAVEADLELNKRADEYQRFGELLMQHLNEVGQRTTHVALDGIDIPLQKELSAVRNAQRYFDKAKRSRIAQQQASERLSGLRATVEPAEMLIKRIEEITTRDALKEFMSEHNNELELFGIGPKTEQREQLPFRIFTVDGGFEVWAGKSSKNNDELTLKHAKPNDLWFHARGAAGSHVILKVNSGKGEPGKKAKEQAASIAAYYSKMKNAKMVPVAMTEKKYVRKPKGAAPGSVTIEREKVIFAEPALPAEKRH